MPEINTAFAIPTFTTSATDTPPAPEALQTAFEATAAARAALAPEALLVINLEIQSAWPAVTGAAAKLKPLRPLIARLPEFDVAQFDLLETYGQAMGYAQRAYATASAPVEGLPALLTRATAMREVLLSDATALAKRGLVDGARLDQLSNAPGYLNTASDVGVLAKLLRDNWSVVGSRSAVLSAEVDEALRVADAIPLAWGLRTHESAVFTKAADDRQRAYTLMIKAYDEARAAVLFVRRHEGDADKFAPSLYAGRTSKGSDATTAPGGTGTAPAKGSPSPVGTTPPAATGSTVVPSPGASPAPATPYTPEPQPASPLPATPVRRNNPFAG